MRPREVLQFGELWWVILLGGLLASVANVIFYFLLISILHQPLLFPNQFPPPELSPLGLVDVILFSVVFAAGAGFVFLVVGRLSQRPAWTFLRISLAVLAVSFALPLSIPSPPVSGLAKLSLVAMHVVGAIAVVGTLLLLGSREIGDEREQA